MQRNEVWWVNFDPAVGGEIQKRRPAVIISNNAANTHLNRVQVIPLSTQVDRLYPSEVLVTLNGKPQKVMIDQLTTVSKRRVLDRIGRLSMDDMGRIAHIIQHHLDLYER